MIVSISLFSEFFDTKVEQAIPELDISNGFVHIFSASCAIIWVQSFFLWESDKIVRL